MGISTGSMVARTALLLACVATLSVVPCHSSESAGVAKLEPESHDALVLRVASAQVRRSDLESDTIKPIKTAKEKGPAPAPSDDEDDDCDPPCYGCQKHGQGDSTCCCPGGGPESSPNPLPPFAMPGSGDGKKTGINQHVQQMGSPTQIAN